MVNDKEKIKIGLVGHGTGGHFYPLIAVGEELNQQSDIVDLIYFGPDKYDEQSLAQIDARFSRIFSGKWRNYLSFKNLVDPFKLLFGFIQAMVKLLYYYPDVIFSKGGYAALPVAIAGKILKIPLLIHDSDIRPGRVSLITSKWAKRVALAWPEAAEFIENDHVAVVGNPIRQGLIEGSKIGGREFLRIPDESGVILILGGSQGSNAINQVVLGGLNVLLQDFHVIHQVGETHFNQMKLATETLLNDDQRTKYHLFGKMNQLAMARALGAADIVITRAGAGGLFEIAAVGQVPAIVIPINNSVNDHQRLNAYAYQDAGAGIVVEESNLAPAVLTNMVTKLLDDKQKYQAMKSKAIKFSPTDAAGKIANEILQLSSVNN
jgi:UDP-N-acetylglucosamine--N-acetylmuramyl-(pentapeptide) pyrophosphoryl-undecaprenol N-acetylglucosamine transferase